MIAAHHPRVRLGKLPTRAHACAGPSLRER